MVGIDILPKTGSNQWMGWRETKLISIGLGSARRHLQFLITFSVSLCNLLIS